MSIKQYFVFKKEPTTHFLCRIGIHQDGIRHRQRDNMALLVTSSAHCCRCNKLMFVMMKFDNEIEWRPYDAAAIDNRIEVIHQTRKLKVMVDNFVFNEHSNSQIIKWPHDNHPSLPSRDFQC